MCLRRQTTPSTIAITLGASEKASSRLMLSRIMPAVMRFPADASRTSRDAAARVKPTLNKGTCACLARDLSCTPFALDLGSQVSSDPRYTVVRAFFFARSGNKSRHLPCGFPPLPRQAKDVYYCPRSPRFLLISPSVSTAIRPPCGARLPQGSSTALIPSTDSIA